MRIFQVITASEYGGAQTMVANLAANLCEDHEVFIFYGGNGEAWKHLSNKIHFIRTNKHRKEISWKDFILALKLFYFRLKYKPDIVHLHSSKMGAIGRIVFAPKSIVYTIHGIDSVRKAFPKFLIVEKSLSNRVARTIGISKYDYRYLDEEGINKNLQLVYNGVIDHTKDDPQAIPNTDIVNQLNNIRRNYARVIMCIARISKQKKFDLFLDVAKQIPKYAFVWIGNKDKIENLPSNVFCLGESHSAYLYLKYADIFMLPSNYEGLPMSILEALSYGVPVIASSVGGITEILDGSNGFAVNNNIKDFVAKIELVLEDENNYQKMRKVARESYLSRYTIDHMVNSYLSIYHDVYNEKNKNK